MVAPNSVREYSTATGFDCVTRLEISPADSRLRRVPVSMRDVPEISAQFAMTTRLLLEQEQDFRGPSANEDPGGRAGYVL